MARRRRGSSRRGRSGRSRRATLIDHLPWLGGIGLVGYLLVEPGYGLAVYILLAVCALIFWGLFLMPTRCDFEVDGRGCRLRVNGKVRGCRQWHARDKRDALFAALQMRNPGMAFRVLWLDSAKQHRGNALGAPPLDGRRSPANASDSVRNRGQALFNLASLFVATVGSVAGVLALFVT